MSIERQGGRPRQRQPRQRTKEAEHTSDQVEQNREQQAQMSEHGQHHNSTGNRRNPKQTNQPNLTAAPHRIEPTHQQRANDTQAAEKKSHLLQHNANPEQTNGKEQQAKQNNQNPPAIPHRKPQSNQNRHIRKQKPLKQPAGTRINTHHEAGKDHASHENQDEEVLLRKNQPNTPENHHNTVSRHTHPRQKPMQRDPREPQERKQRERDQAAKKRQHQDGRADHRQRQQPTQRGHTTSPQADLPATAKGTTGIDRRTPTAQDPPEEAAEGTRQHQLAEQTNQRGGTQTNRAKEKRKADRLTSQLHERAKRARTLTPPNQRQNTRADSNPRDSKKPSHEDRNETADHQRKARQKSNNQIQTNSPESGHPPPKKQHPAPRSPQKAAHQHQKDAKQTSKKKPQKPRKKQNKYPSNAAPSNSN
ncbi:hypothetical protein [endosymbiont of Riftia pachyptila]|nr:hypothetical protein [endosymbiont of Riftia pachyptila]